MSEPLSPAQVAEIRERYEGFDQPDPPCTCTRMDVDYYDTSGCERCDDKSDYNQAYRHAKYMLEIHGAQDISALIASHELMRKQAVAFELAERNGATNYRNALRLAVEANERAERAIQLLMQVKAYNRALATELARVTKESELRQSKVISYSEDARHAEQLNKSLLAELAALKQERDELRDASAKDGIAHLNTIDERDAAEDWFGKLAALFGVDTEFSNLRGYADIYNDCAVRAAQQEGKP